MLKEIILYLIVFLLVGATACSLHLFWLGETGPGFDALLKKAYAFHFVFSLVLLIAFQGLARSTALFEQLGFIYMGALLVKIVSFAALFYPQLLGEDLLPRLYRASLLIPVIVFLALEVIFISKLMQGKKA